MLFSGKAVRLNAQALLRAELARLLPPGDTPEGLMGLLIADPEGLSVLVLLRAALRAPAAMLGTCV